MAVNQFQHQMANKILMKPGSIIPYTTEVIQALISVLYTVLCSRRNEA
jgi:hypothetical protein